MISLLGRGGGLKSELEIYVAAEFAAIEQLLTRMLAHMAIQADRQGLDHDAYLSGIMEASLRDLDLVDFWDIPNEQKEATLERCKARLTAIVTAASARG